MTVDVDYGNDKKIFLVFFMYLLKNRIFQLPFFLILIHIWKKIIYEKLLGIGLKIERSNLIIF